ncbi:MAG: hypothetical protein IJ149_05865 [Oscillospiraceae bacterium]|nr:hypothetical protein [Oscillospiraceae bacterium]
MSARTVNIRYGVLMLIMMIIALLSRISNSWYLHDSSHIVMLLVCVVWFNTLKYRIIIPALRRLLTAMAVMLGVLSVLTVCRYTLFSFMPLTSRYLNYLYQVPVLMCTLLSFYSALCIGKPDPVKILKRHKWMAVICGLIITGYLTNDLHHLAYRTVSPEGKVTGHFIICYISWMFQAITIGTSFVIILRRSRISNIRRFALLPSFFLLTGSAMLTATVIYGHIMIGPLKITFQPVFTFMMIGFWESCIIIGLVPSNSRYMLLMDFLPLNMQITDKNGKLKFDSAKMNITAEQRNAALAAPVMLESYLVLNSRSIPGGYAFWTEDRSKIERLNNELRERTDDLRYKNELLSRENRIKEDKARYEVQNNTYMRLSADLQPTAERIRTLLDKGDLAQACLLGTYIKRRANLYLLAQQRDTADISELYHSVAESLDSLRLLDITCSVYTENEEWVPSAALIDAYDWFESVAESKMRSSRAAMVVIGAKDGIPHITVNISGDGISDDEGCFRYPGEGGASR